MIGRVILLSIVVVVVAVFFATSRVTVKPVAVNPDLPKFSNINN